MEKKLTKSDFFWAFVRSNFLQGSWNMERMQALGYAFGMVPILRRLYEGEELKKAMIHIDRFDEDVVTEEKPNWQKLKKRWKKSRRKL